jgi:glycosyltransferase involved in cell wall biosynthesis
MSTKTVLFVTSYLPNDFGRDVHGSFQRMRMFIDAWAVRGWDITFFFFLSPLRALQTDSDSVREKIKQFWNVGATVKLCVTAAVPELRNPSFYDYYVAPALALRNDPDHGAMCGPEQLRQLSASLAAGPDAIFVFRLEAMLPMTLLAKPSVPVYFDIDDIEHRKAMRALATAPSSKGKWLRYLKVLAIMRAERAAVALAVKTFVCSKIDNAYLARKFRSSRIHTIPNAVDFPAGQRPQPGGNTVLFVGLLSYAPNNAAVRLLINDIWPRISRRKPDARLVIVGAGAETIEGRERCPSSVHFAGFAPDLRRYYEEALIMCCPIMVGGGTRIKLIEAAAYGKAIVSTTVGAEGLELQDGVHALIRDTPESIAEACIGLLGDVARAGTLGLSARTFAGALYSRDAVVRQIAAQVAS